MGGGTTVDGKGDINKMVGIMSSGDAPANTNPISGTKKYIIIHYRDIGVVGAFAEEAEKIAEQRQRQTA